MVFAQRPFATGAEDGNLSPEGSGSESRSANRCIHQFVESYPMDGTWCIAPEIQRRKSRYRYDFIRPFDLYLKFMGVELEQDLSWITPHVMRHTFGSPLAIAGERA